MTADELGGLDPRPGERLLLKTRNSERRWEREPLEQGFVCLGAEARRLLAERKVQAVGVDYLSVGRPGEEGDEVHRIQLGAGIWLIEGINLGEVEPGPYELICLPLRGLGGDGAAARAVLRRP